MTQPSVLIPIAPGTNRNEDLAAAFVAAGAAVHQLPLQALRSGEVKLIDHQMLALPGGFSYGDALGAGRLLGLDLRSWFADELHEARARSMPIIGICNGFQALVKSGILPGPVPPAEAGDATSADGQVDDAVDDTDGAGPTTTVQAVEPIAVQATLSHNENGRFECRWVHLAPQRSDSPWLSGLSQPIRCPVAHGEGRFVSSDLAAIEAAGQVAFRYGSADGTPAGGAYPANPNGSGGDVAGIVDSSGLVLGLMPHPEDHVFARQDPQWRRELGGGCLPLFQAGVRVVAAD